MKKTTSFGFKQVDAQDKQNLVDRVFSSVAHKYDLMNDAMSLGIHRLWKMRMLQELRPNKSLLDMASGTGDIARLYHKKCEHSDITLSDINFDMLNVARAKLIDHNVYKGLKFVCSNAENLAFQDLQFDYYTIAFGIRNVTNIDKALSEAHRVLKPGGKFICLEFSKVSNKMLTKLYDFYSMNIIPKLGDLIVGDKESYQYLVESIRMFPSQEEFITMMKNAGFKVNNYTNLTGGIVSLYTGYRV